MIEFESFEQLENMGFVPSDREKEILKMAMKDSQDIYFSENGIVAVFVTINDNGDEFDLVSIEKK